VIDAKRQEDKSEITCFVRDLVQNPGKSPSFWGRGVHRTANVELGLPTYLQVIWVYSEYFYYVPRPRVALALLAHPGGMGTICALGRYLRFSSSELLVSSAFSSLLHETVSN